MAKGLEWTFPQAVAGVPDQGGAEAGAETFGGDVQASLARETIQNSLDAAATTGNGKRKAVKVVFAVEQIPISEIPAIRELASRLDESANYLSDQPRYQEVFRRAAELAGAKKITCLRVSDYNTTGISGKDDERGSSWHGLVHSNGSSAKAPGAGGSFGIGKSAVFAASGLRTVLYSTRNESNRYIFQGVARLTTHYHGDRKCMPTGFLGESLAASVRKKDRIPPRFRRADEPGADVICLGYDASGNWIDELVASVVQNFWPAIHWGQLEVDVGGVAITKRTLKKLVALYGKSALPFFEAYVSKDSSTHAETLPTLGKVQLRLLTPVEDGPNQIALVRGIGMVVRTQRVQTSLQYAGVFECRDPKGNDVLRSMEPPQHDAWDPNRPEKNANRKAKQELDDFLREKVRALAPADAGDTIEMNELSPYLPDESPEGEPTIGGAPGGGADDGAEGLDKAPKEREVTGRPTHTPKPTRPQSDAEDDDEGDDPIIDDGDVVNPPGPPRPPSDAKPKPGTPGGSETRQAVLLASERAFVLDAGETYRVIVRPAKAANMELHLAAVGDDNLVNPERQQAVEVIDETTGEKVAVGTDGAIGPLWLPADAPTVLTVKLRRARRLALEVKAYEAA